MQVIKNKNNMLNTRTLNTNQSVTFNPALRHEDHTIKFARPKLIKKVCPLRDPPTRAQNVSQNVLNLTGLFPFLMKKKKNNFKVHGTAVFADVTGGY